MRNLSLYAFLLVLLFSSQVEAQTVINFDNLSADTAVTNQYPEATFSSTFGNTNWAVADNFGSSLPNIIGTGPTVSNISADEPTYIDFTNPVHNLTFVGVAIDDVGKVAEVRVFVNGNLNSTVDIIGQGNVNVPVTVDLSAFQNVTRIEIVNITDGEGMGWDDFSFNVGATSISVPIMNQWGMIIFILLAGLGAVYYLRRQRRTVSLYFRQL